MRKRKRKNNENRQKRERENVRKIEYERSLERKIIQSNLKSERGVEREEEWQKGGDERENICKGKYRNIELETMV